MRKIHLIAAAEPLVLDLAFAIKEKGHDVSVSGEALTEDVITRLQNIGCICHGNGWSPEKLTKDLHSVVLGTTVDKNNPELVQAKKLGLLTQSVPEFIFQRTKSKTRVVVAGSRGKKSILSMIIYALQQKKMHFDYVLTSEVLQLPSRIQMSYESRIALIEGDEHITSSLEKRFQLEFYRPHIAVIPTLSWSEDNDYKSFDDYLNTYRAFISTMEREGKLIYFEGDSTVSQLAQEVREDITSIPYDRHVVLEKDGNTFLHTRYGDYEIYIPDNYFLANLNAARLVCRQLGIKDANFYRAISEYSLSLQA